MRDGRHPGPAVSEAARPSRPSLRERVRPCPAWSGCCPPSEGLPPGYLVGGAVRDLLRGAQPVDLDLAVEGDAASAARRSADRLGGEVREHGRFGTAGAAAERRMSTSP